MRASFSSILAIAATLPLTTLAHYNFEALIVNGNITDPYEYVRQTTNSNSPIEDITSDDMICNQGGLDADIRAKTKTHTVAPGDEVGYSVNVNIGHPGPLAVYLSKAPDGTEASDYLGGGEWFKVYELSTSSITDAGLQWATYADNSGIQNFTFTLPENLAPGNYLMRAEHIALHAASTKGGAQFYIGCAQLAVTGSGSGSPSPTVKIPGYLTGDEPGVLINIYYPVPTNYTAPGPKTWPKGCEDHTANFVGRTSDGDCTGSDSGSDSSSGSGSSAVEPPASTPTPVVSAPSSTAGDNTVITTSLAPAVTSAASGNEAATSVQSEAPVSTSTKTPSKSCSAKRKSRKAKRAAELAQKRALEELMRRAVY